MIENEIFFDDMAGRLFAWCDASVAGTDLAAVAAAVLENKMTRISAAPDAVGALWPWLEKTGVDIAARFYVQKVPAAARAAAAADLSGRINAAFRQGASSAEIFVPTPMLDGFVSEMRAVRDDLFFNRELAIGLDIDTIEPSDWNAVFEELKFINASSVVFALAADAGDKSDFVGRVFGMLSAFDDEFSGAVHFALVSPRRVEQVWRLAQQVQPNLCDRIGFFIPVGTK